MADYTIKKGVCAFLCFARCVLYTIVLLYLFHLSPCNHLEVALQSVIYVYW